MKLYELELFNCNWLPISPEKARKENRIYILAKDENNKVVSLSGKIVENEFWHDQWGKFTRYKKYEIESYKNLENIELEHIDYPLAFCFGQTDSGKTFTNFPDILALIAKCKNLNRISIIGLVLTDIEKDNDPFPVTFKLSKIKDNNILISTKGTVYQVVDRVTMKIWK